MPQFSLVILDNTISNTNADVSFAVTCDDPPSNALIKHIDLEIPMLAEVVEWSGVKPAITTPLNSNGFHSTVGPMGGLSVGQIRFSFDVPTKLADYNNRIEFCINDLYAKEGQEFPPSADIAFKFKNLGNQLISGTYIPNTILVAAKKPVINSFRINPSIIRPANDITITYQTTDASTCELKDSLGKTMDFRTVTDPATPFNCSMNFGLGSAGSSPCPPFYLHARNGAMEALENTVANVITTSTPQWQVLDNFSCEVRKEIDGNVIYVIEQYTLLDLVLNEYDDMMWAIMQKKTDPAAPPSIWNSRDGLSWKPHTIMVNDGDVMVPAMLTIPSELAYCPCLHFGNNELYFVGGSKADISVCKNTISKIDLDTGFREDLPPAAMKPRCMHACVLFPDVNGNDNIWVIGGADKNGNGLNDVWRFDGSNWIAVPTDPAFPKRCQFAVTVQTDINKNKSIWIGGGAARYNGSTLNDVWIYRTSSGWKKARNEWGTGDFIYDEQWIAGASICYLRTNKNSNIDPSGSYRYIISSDISVNSSTGKRELKSGWIQGVDIGNNYYKWTDIKNVDKPEFPSIFESVRSFATATIGFNGCVWTVIVAYISKGNIAVSKLYYSCPEP
ncbi:kelch repeat-containing protein [Chitinophaga ginsengisoli]|uniref:Galactose oxidase-like protein n=1 Tax=Chitinophaga ginsengisoli TaxID=363837 RepID=A0A2P8GLS6_9BACT|nr:kelch repeat-containing protein [Chitinophaga ginsengisoli]PSL34903.1 galactose oxidase-like protein [Chitinophaga ginsengisoli]